MIILVILPSFAPFFHPYRTTTSHSNKPFKMETRYNIVRNVALLQPRTGLWGCSKDGNREKNHAQKRRKKDTSKDDKQA